MRKCTYCGKGYHPESSYMNKQIDILTQILDNHNISLPEGTNKKESASNFEDEERVHALEASTVRSYSFNIDLGASRHMVLTREAFSSLDDLNGAKIVF